MPSLDTRRIMWMAISTISLRLYCSRGVQRTNVINENNGWQYLIFPKNNRLCCKWALTPRFETRSRPSSKHEWAKPTTRSEGTSFRRERHPLSRHSPTISFPSQPLRTRRRHRPQPSTTAALREGHPLSLSDDSATVAARWLGLLQARRRQAPPGTPTLLGPPFLLCVRAPKP